LYELVLAERAALVGEALDPLPRLGPRHRATDRHLPFAAARAVALDAREDQVAVPADGALGLAELEDLHGLRGVEDAVLGQVVLDADRGVRQGGLDLFARHVAEPQGDTSVGGFFEDAATRRIERREV